MLIGLYIASRLNDAANSLRLLAPDRANERTAEALENWIYRLGAKSRKRKADQILIYEQFNGNPPPPGIRQVDIEDEESLGHS